MQVAERKPTHSARIVPITPAGVDSRERPSQGIPASLLIRKKSQGPSPSPRREGDNDRAASASPNPSRLELTISAPAAGNVLRIHGV